MVAVIVERDNSINELSDELFRVQCRILDLGTDTSLSGPKLRRELMNLRQEIIDFRERTAIV